MKLRFLLPILLLFTTPALAQESIYAKKLNNVKEVWCDTNHKWNFYYKYEDNLKSIKADDHYLYIIGNRGLYQFPRAMCIILFKEKESCLGSTC